VEIRADVRLRQGRSLRRGAKGGTTRRNKGKRKKPREASNQRGKNEKTVSSNVGGWSKKGVHPGKKLKNSAVGKECPTRNRGIVCDLRRKPGTLGNRERVKWGVLNKRRRILMRLTSPRTIRKLPERLKIA